MKHNYLKSNKKENKKTISEHSEHPQVSTANTPQLASAQRKPTINREHREPTCPRQRQHTSAASNIASAIARAIILLLIVTTSGCVSYEDLRNFRADGPLPTNTAMTIANYQEPAIQVSDVLHIKVSSLNQEAVLPFLPENELQAVGGNNPQLLQLNGYQVDADGTIDFPVIGRLEVGGKTLMEAEQLLRSRLTEYVRDVVVDMRYLNFRVTISGEVTRPGVFTMPQERVSLIEAIGMAGDLTPYANRDSILVIRELDGERSYGYVNVRKAEVFDSPFYYLRQNDIIYVEPLKAKTGAVRDQSSEVLPFITAAVSVIALLVSVLRK